MDNRHYFSIPSLSSYDPKVRLLPPGISLPPIANERNIISLHAATGKGEEEANGGYLYTVSARKLTEEFTNTLTMAYRRDRSIREAYEERFLPDRPQGPYPRGGGGAPERRAPFRPDEEYNRSGYEYEGGPRFFPNGGGPRNYHGEDQRSYHGDGHHFPAERRSAPPSRREEYPYRVPREEPHTGRPMEFSTRAPPPPAVRNPALYPAPRTLPAVVPEGRDDTLMQAILSLDRSEERDHYRRKVSSFAPIRERSPVRTRDVARSPHSRSGSSVSSRGYSPDRAKGLPFPSQQGKNKVPGLSTDASPQSTTSNKDEPHASEVEKEEAVLTASAVAMATTVVPAATVEESHKTVVPDDFQERRSLAIAAKAQEIEKVYRQDCETFGMVVKMLVAKDPSLEKQLQVPLRENLGEIRERCLEELKHYISDLDEMARQPEPVV